MEIDLATIRLRYDGIMTSAYTREEASDWARLIREADDRHELSVTPKADREAILEALAFIEMYDMKISQNEYIYGEEDLVANRPRPEKGSGAVD